VADREHREGTAKRRLVTVFAVVGFSAPIAAYFWLIHSFGVNVPLGDQLTDVNIIGDSYSGHLSFAELWAQHNENRIFFPHLIVLLLSRTTHFNIVFEEYVSAVLLVIAIGLLVLTHRQNAGRIWWVFYCPVAILMLSFVQYQNSLWGFQLAWYLVLFAFTIVLFLLDQPRLTPLLLALSITSGIVASFSSLQGLIVWPLGVLLLSYRHRPRASVIVWIVAGTATTVVYFVGYRATTAGTNTYAFHHPVAAVEFYLVAIGDIVGANISGTGPIEMAVLLLGLVIVVASVWAVVLCIGRTKSGGDLVAAALICFGLLFAVIVTDGRTTAGLSAASQSRYRTFDLLIVVGLYLVVLGRFSARATAPAVRSPPGASGGEGGGSEPRSGTSGAHSDRRSFPIFAAVVIAVVCLQVGIGIPTGLAGAESDHADQVLGARILVNISKYSDSCLGMSYYSSSFRRQMADVLEAHHLSLFATADAAKYRAEGLITFPLPSMTVVVLAEKPVLRGVQNLDAIVSDNCDIATVEFEATGEGLDHAMISSAVPSPYGWIGIWRTTTVDDGRYTLQGVAVLSSGREVLSPGIRVVVQNH
jgi:hypothetical protein